MGNFSFIGNYSYTIDEKNRFNIPAKFRRQLDDASNDSLVLTVGMDHCISIYPLSRWKEELKAIQNLNRNKQENRQFIRAIASNAVDVKLDKQGRVIIPKHLKDYAKLEKTIILVGVFDSIELWDEESYRREMKEPLANLDSLAERLAFSNE